MDAVESYGSLGPERVLKLRMFGCESYVCVICGYTQAQAHRTLNIMTSLFL